MLQTILTNHVYIIYVYKEELALNNPQGLIWHKTQPANIDAAQLGWAVEYAGCISAAR